MVFRNLTISIVIEEQLLPCFNVAGGKESSPDLVHASYYSDFEVSLFWALVVDEP